VRGLLSSLVGGSDLSLSESISPWERKEGSGGREASPEMVVYKKASSS
jgi:hypothetical protein